MTWIGRLAGGFAALVVSSLLAGPALAGGPSSPPPAPKKWLPWFEGGGYLSTEQHRGESNLFAPIWQSSVALLFFQGTGKYFEDDIQEGNFAIGFRKMNRSGWNFGLWGGYDVRSSEEDNVFHQISFGFEALSDKWDVRANGYVAVSDPEASPGLAQVVLTGNNIFLIGGEEVPLSGFDGEVGYKIFSKRGGHGGGLKDGPAPHGRSHEVRVYAGGFYFDDDDALEEVAGPRARIEWRIDDVFRGLPGSRLTLEGEFQYDEVREDQWEGGVRLRLPFGGGGQDARATLLASLTPQERRMTESLVRDTDIVTVESEEENVFDTLTGVTFNQVGFVQGGGDLQGTLNANGQGSLVILNGGTTIGSFVLGPSQTLQGGGSTVQVTGVKSGTTANFTAPGAQPLLSQTLNQSVLAVDSNTHVAGLVLTGAGEPSGLADNDGIVPTANGVSNVAITQSTITDFGGRAIEFEDDHNNIRIYHTVIRRTDLDSLEFDDNNSNIHISHVTITDIDNRGIDISEFNSNVIIENSTIANTANRAINVNTNARNFTIRNVNITNTGNDSIDFNTDVDGLLIQNVSINGSPDDGIEIGSRANNVTIQNVTIQNVNQIGIDLSNDSIVTINNTTITNAGTDGLDMGTNNTITMNNTTFAGTFGDDVIDINGAGNTLSGSGNVNNAAAIGGVFCEVTGAQTGAFLFTNGATCP